MKKEFNKAKYQTKATVVRPTRAGMSGGSGLKHKWHARRSFLAFLLGVKK